MSKKEMKIGGKVWQERVKGRSLEGWNWEKMSNYSLFEYVVSILNDHESAE